MQPILSVIVPVYKAPDTFLSLLSSLAHQKTSIPFEIVIADDASPDDTALRVRKHISQNSTSLFNFIRLEKNQGPAGARNTAMEHAQGEVFLLIDADTVIRDEDHIAKLWKAHLEYPEAILGGGVNGIGKGYAAFCDNYCHWATNIPGVSAHCVDSKHLTTAHMLLPKGVWKQIGPFDLRLRTGEDTAFCLKALQRGITLRLHGEIVLDHIDRQSWRDLWRCFYETGRDRRSSRMIAYGKAPWFLSGPKILRVFLAPTIALALTAGHLRTWWTHDKRVVLALPGILFAMFAMGCGVATGRGKSI